jgi:hypothetical protein
MTPAQVLAEVMRRLLYLAKLRRYAEALTRPGWKHDKLPASALAAVVADAMKVEDSPWFRKDLTAALKGWRSVRNGNVRMWKGVTLR